MNSDMVVNSITATTVDGNEGRYIVDTANLVDDDDNNETTMLPPPPVTKKIRKTVLIDETQNTIRTSRTSSTVNNTSSSNGVSSSSSSSALLRRRNRSSNGSNIPTAAAAAISNIPEISASAWRLLHDAEQRVGIVNNNNNIHTDLNNSTTVTIPTTTSVKQAIATLRKAYKLNTLQRAKGQPPVDDDAFNRSSSMNDNHNEAVATSAAAAAGYMESEVALYEAIIQFKTLATAMTDQQNQSNDNTTTSNTTTVTNYYSTLLEQHVIEEVFVPLVLYHDNIDIVITIVSVLVEWFDTTNTNATAVTVAGDVTTNETDSVSNSVIQQQQQQLANELFASGAMEQIVDPTTLHRMIMNQNNTDTDDDDDVGQGIDDVLSLIEQLLYLDTIPTTTTTIATKNNKSNINNSNTTSSTTKTRPQQQQSMAFQLCQHCPNFISWLFYIQQQPESDCKHSNNNSSSKCSSLLLLYVPYRQRAMELLTTVTTREEIYTTTTLENPLLLDWTHLPPPQPVSNTTTIPKTSDERRNCKNSTKESQEQLPVYIDAIEIVLQNIGQFRKRQPMNTDEMEYIENCCIVMTSLLTYSSSSSNTTANTITAFIDRQGIELVMRCLKQRVYAGAATLVWLDFSSSTTGGGNSDITNNDTTTHHAGPTTSNRTLRHAHEYMVNVGILKYIFPLFMGKNLPKYCDDSSSVLALSSSSTTSSSRKQKMKRKKNEFYNKIETTTIRILYNFVRYLQDDSPNDVKDRFIAKFMDTNTATATDASTATVLPDSNVKISRLIDLYIKYDQQVRLAEYKFYQSDLEDAIHEQSKIGSDQNNDDDSTTTTATILQYAVLETKLQAGGDSLYRLAAIIAFCCCTSRLCHEQILEQLKRKQSGISVIKDTLLEFISMLDDMSDQRMILQKLYDQT